MIPTPAGRDTDRTAWRGIHHLTFAVADLAARHRGFDAVAMAVDDRDALEALDALDALDAPPPGSTPPESPART